METYNQIGLSRPILTSFSLHIHSPAIKLRIIMLVALVSEFIDICCSRIALEPSRVSIVYSRTQRSESDANLPGLVSL